MPDIKFILPGPETVTLARQTIDKLIRAGDGDATLLYLYILKTRGQSTLEETASEMGKSLGAVATAMALLSRLGLIKLDDGTEASTQDYFTRVPARSPIDEPRQYSIEEIKGELEIGSEFHALIQETQNSLGKILSPDEMLRLFGIYDGLRLPPEVILLLITHCINESRGRGGGRMPSIRYIEKAAYTWEREGIFCLDRAEEYLKALEARKSVRGEIKKAMQIKDREFSESEKQYVDGWIAMGYGADAIGIAYDRTLLKTGKLAWGYLDKIIKSWHSKNLHTPQEILEKDKLSNRNSAQVYPSTPEQKFGAPNHEEIERMQRLLNKIKEA